MRKSGTRAQKAGAKTAKRRSAVAEKKKLDQISGGLAGRIALGAGAPIEHCVRMRALFETGIGHVIVARRLPSHILSCAFFLVDVYCLGVKDIFHTELSPLDFAKHFEELKKADDFVDMDPVCARKLLRDAVAYATKAGLKPAKDYAAIVKIFGEINADECAESFVFGKDGKTVYVAGPNDTPAKVRDIVTKLQINCRPDEWDFVLPLLGDDDEDLLFENEAEDWGRDDGLLIEHDPKPE